MGFEFLLWEWVLVFLVRCFLSDHGLGFVS